MVEGGVPQETTSHDRREAFDLISISIIIGMASSSGINQVKRLRAEEEDGGDVSIEFNMGVDAEINFPKTDFENTFISRLENDFKGMAYLAAIVRSQKAGL